MSDDEPMTRSQLIFRALQEDHMAITAQSGEAALAHRELARRMRAQAKEMETGDESGLEE